MNRVTKADCISYTHSTHLILVKEKQYEEDSFGSGFLLDGG